MNTKDLKLITLCKVLKSRICLILLIWHRLAIQVDEILVICSLQLRVASTCTVRAVFLGTVLQFYNNKLTDCIFSSPALAFVTKVKTCIFVMSALYNL